MKTRYLFSMLAIAALFASCSKEMIEVTPEVAPQSNLVEVGENFMVYGTPAADTKSMWYVDGNELKFSILPVADAAAGNNTIATQKVDARQIGLCWLGTTPGSDIYTNYLFYHNGWLAAGETEPWVNCNTLENGWLYSEITGINPTDPVAPGMNVTPVAADAKDYLDAATSADDFNLNSGVYKTDNLSMFGGDYIVYYPYDPEITEVGKLVASSPLTFENLPFVPKANVASALNAPELADNTFAYGYAPALVGGSTTSGFETHNLSGIIQLNIKAKAGYTLTGEISKIALLSDEGFVSSVELDAAKIVAGEDPCIAGTEETSGAIVASIPTTALVANEEYRCFFPALPTTVTNLRVVLYKDVDGGEAAAIAVVPATLSGNEVVAGTGKVVSIEVANDNFNANTFLAVDEATLRTAITAAVATGKSSVINVLGDVTLTDDLEIATIGATKTLTIQGSTIIVPAPWKLTVKDNAIMNSDIVVLGQPCCTTTPNGGKLDVENCILNGDVFIAPAQNYVPGNEAGLMTVVSQKSAIVNGDIINEGLVTFAASTTANVRTTMTLNGSIENDGLVEITKTATALDNADSKLDLAANGRINNNSEITVHGVLAITGTIANNAGAYIYDRVSSQVTGAIAQLFGAAGEYVSDVNNNTDRYNAALNSRPTTIMNFVDNATTYDMTKFNSHRAPIDQIWVSIDDVDFTTASAAKAGRVADLSDIDLYVKANTNVVIDNKTATAAVGLSTITFKDVFVEGNKALTIGKTGSKSDKATNSFIAANVTVKGATGADKANKLVVANDIFAQFGTLTVAKATKKGYFEVGNNAEVDVLGQISVSGAATILIASGDPSNIAGIVWYPQAGPAPVGNANWENGIPTQRF